MLGSISGPPDSSRKVPQKLHLSAVRPSMPLRILRDISIWALAELQEKQDAPANLPEIFCSESYRQSFLPLLKIECLEILKSAYRRIIAETGSCNNFLFHTNICLQTHQENATENIKDIYGTIVDKLVCNNDVLVLSETHDIRDGLYLMLCRGSTELHNVDFQENRSNQKYHAFNLGNLTTLLRIENAIISYQRPTMLKTILDPTQNYQVSLGTLPRYSYAYKLSLQLNSSQKSAQMEVLAFNPSGISIIQGPPGIYLSFSKFKAQEKLGHWVS